MPAPQLDDVDASSDVEGRFVEMLRDLGRFAEEEVLSWHAALSREMPSRAAWAVLALPVALVLALIPVAIARRRRPEAGARVEARKRRPPDQRSAPAETAERPEDIELEIGPVDRLVLASDGRPSLHETLIALGADAPAVMALREAAPGAIDGSTWAAAVGGLRLDLVAPLRARWINRLAARRVGDWLQAVTRSRWPGLEVHMPEVLSVDELESVTLVRKDGLGISLTPEQNELVAQGRRALHVVLERPADPYSLIAEGMRRNIPALSGGREEAERAVTLAMLLHGLDARQRAVGRRRRTPMEKELREALEAHRVRRASDVRGEGCAAHLLHMIDTERSMPGLGTLLAAAAGAAFSPMAVTVQISKAAGELPAGAAEPLSRLGELFSAALAEGSETRTLIHRNAGRLLGGALLVQEETRAAKLIRKIRRRSDAEPLWATRRGAPPPPDIATARLHRKIVTLVSEEVGAGAKRLMAILDRLAYPGKAGENKPLAAQRLGYVGAALGVELVKDAGAHLTDASREAAAALGLTA
jgi:hypothetical protein